METEKKKCPLNGMNDCLEDECAWFDAGEVGRCAIWEVAFNTNIIANNLYDLDGSKRKQRQHQNRKY